MNKFLLLTACLFLFTAQLFSQERNIAMNATAWNINEESMQFKEHQGTPALHISGDGIATIQDLN